MIIPGFYIRDILREAAGRQITANGWVKARRDSKNVHFIQLNDGSSTDDLQVVAEVGTIPQDVIIQLTIGACISVQGELVASTGRGQAVELSARQLTLHSTADANAYPLQKKKLNFDTLRELCHLRSRTKTFSSVFRIRNQLSMAIHKFFQERGFIFVHTPIISVSDAKGAGSMFQVTTLDMEEIAKSGKAPDYSNQDFFRNKTFLTVSGQLEAEIFAHAFANVYTFGPTFRAEHSDTPRHLAEFYMIEPEMAFCDLAENQVLAEAFLKDLTRQILNNCQPELEFLNEVHDRGLVANLQLLVNSDFERISYTTAVNLLEKADCTAQFPISWGASLQSEHERYLTEVVFKKPVVVTDYPRGIKAFYMRDNEDGKTAAAMDVLVPRIGEIIGGGQREERHDILLDKISKLSTPVVFGNPPEEEYGWYLDLRRFGGVTHSGFGMGFERMMMYLTGMKNIRDVIPFPRFWKRGNSS